MALTPSNMLPLGTVASNFTLPDSISGNEISLSNYKGKKATVIMFICNHCPFVKHVNKELASLANDYKNKDVRFIAISSNDVANYPADSPELMKQNAIDEGFNFPYLYDESQQVARDYDAACTPDFYVFDHNLKLTYRGQLDDSRPGNGIPVTGQDLRAAIDTTITGRPIITAQKPSIGCNIKWRT